MESQKKLSERISFTWKAKAKKKKTFKIAATKSKTITIDWGDGSVIESIIGKDRILKLNHLYKVDGIFTVIISASTSDCYFKYFHCSKQEVTDLNLSECASLEYLLCDDNQLDKQMYVFRSFNML